MSASSSQPEVAIVLCTFNGEKHLEDQLQSLISQSWPIAVYAFDDGSTDNTVEKLSSFAHKLKLSIIKNPENLGYVRNFELGISTVIAAGHDFIALCDQDDIWDPERIETGMRAMMVKENELGKQACILSHSDLSMISADKQLLHESFLKYRRYNIGKSKSLPLVLGQNGIMGNTILLNRSLATFALPFPDNLHVHDYWLALLTELYGHRIMLEEPMVSYRIHKDNASNSSDSIPLGAQKVRRKKSLLSRWHRNHELPFKEDSRIDCIRFIANNKQRFPELDRQAQKDIAVFEDYLEFKRSRVSILFAMLRRGFFRTGIKHRFRVVFRALVTNRYEP